MQCESAVRWQCKITTFLLVANLAGMRLSASSKQTCFLYILMTDYLFFTNFGRLW